MSDTPETDAARPPTPYQKIMRAAKRVVGLRLSANEVAALADDDAIWTAALNDDHPEDGGDAAGRRRGE